MKYNVKDTILRYKADEDLKFHFFWNGPFSQWKKSPFSEIIDGKEKRFITCEQYMMAKKALLFNDQDCHDKIMIAVDPSDQKMLGRMVQGFDDAIWDKHKYQTVINGNVLKFTRNVILKKMLMDTGDKILVEASPYDRVWGIGMNEKNTQIYNPINWNGQNLLGYALMEVRDIIRQQLDNNNENKEN